MKATVDDYSRQFDEFDEHAPTGTAAELSRDCCQLVSDFYEYGWGQSFHFALAPAARASKSRLARYEDHLATRMGLKKGLHVLDVGCGVSGLWLARNR